MRARYLRVTENDTQLLEQAAALITRMYGPESHYSTWIQNGFRPYSSEYLLGQVRNPKRQLWVMIQDAKVIGTIIIQDNGSHALLHKFTIDPAYKGAGAKLLAYAEKIAYKLGFVRLRVEVFSAASKLVNYYIAHKYNKAIVFTPLNEDEHIRYVNGGDYGFITLEKTLKS
jgi:hypothetical protein